VQFLYARVSTSDQTAAHRLQQARAAGFDLDEDNVIKDEGVSGISTCFAEREDGRRLRDKLRAGDGPVVRWLDRLGRNYDDVRDTVQRLMRKGVILRTMINNFTFDGSQTDPIQKSIRDGLLNLCSEVMVRRDRQTAPQDSGPRRQAQR
jgi:putative DNA-invertase from lambdoid prophage Rac